MYLHILVTAEIAFSVALMFSRLLDSESVIIVHKVGNTATNKQITRLGYTRCTVNDLHISVSQMVDYFLPTNA